MTVLLAHAAYPRGIDKPRTRSAKVIFYLVALITILPGCGPASQTGTQVAAVTDQATTPRFAGTTLRIAPEVLTGEPEKNALRSAFIGDLHLHTDYSFDAYAFVTPQRLTMPIAAQRAMPSLTLQVSKCSCGSR